MAQVQTSDPDSDLAMTRSLRVESKLDFGCLVHFESKHQEN